MESEYSKWFKRNCDNNNIPNLAEVHHRDYDAWFERHSEKRKCCCCCKHENYDDWFKKHSH